MAPAGRWKDLLEAALPMSPWVTGSKPPAVAASPWAMSLTAWVWAPTLWRGVYPSAAVTSLFVSSPRISAEDLFSTLPNPTSSLV